MSAHSKLSKVKQRACQLGSFVLHNTSSCTDLWINHVCRGFAAPQGVVMTAPLGAAPRAGTAL